MSIHIPIEERQRLPWHRRLLPLVAVGVAHLIGRLSPRQIRRLLTRCARGARAATDTEAATARQAVVSVSVRCAGHGCVPRSIATALLCRVHGTWPTWHTGVRTQPFTAHAWVEADGQPVNEPHTTTYLHPLITVPPTSDNTSSITKCGCSTSTVGTEGDQGDSRSHECMAAVPW